MSYTEAEARQRLLDDLARAVDRLALALACLGAAYEELNEDTAERLGETLFRPAQRAYAHAQRAHAEFSERNMTARRSFAPVSAGLESQRATELLAKAADALEQAEDAIGQLQDSLLPVEVGDLELRSALASVRMTIDRLPNQARELIRVVGR